MKIAPSILSANFSNLGKDIKLLEKGGADWIHLDVMDGNFVPNITFGPIVIKSLRKITRLPLDAHLMIQKPERYIEDFKNSGVDNLTVHLEATTHLHRTVSQIKKLGMKAGVSINPSTPAISLREILPFVDLVLVMTVNPGFGGQTFIPTMIRKIQEIALMIESSGNKIELQVDGGVDETNIKKIYEAGATISVTGYSIFSKKNIPNAIKKLKSLTK
ncbi:MAG: ribulose-phosphate 3-epimerase [Ignavibacteriales bacterium]|nr:ribulose-phosphate 3-epimerase [Ignavibacteriales bacterium]